MGLFKFMKNAGDAVFGSEGKKAVDIEERINKALGDKIQGLSLEFDDGVVKFTTGICDSPDTMEKAILLAGNIDGVEEVDDDGLSLSVAYLNAQKAKQEEEKKAAEEEKKAEEEAKIVSQFYTIKSGDTLSKVAKEFYGNANKYMVIFEANREILKDPDKIYPGQTLRIPPLEK